MRIRDWRLLLTHAIVNLIASTTDDAHLRTDPACARFVAPRPGSRLDSFSRGQACSPCMVDRAWGRGRVPLNTEQGDR